jgi:glycosyltransferase involved in cell wall biosynthesis
MSQGMEILPLRGEEGTRAAPRPRAGRRAIDRLARALAVLTGVLSGRVVRRLRQRRYARLIRRSRLFVPEFYLAQCAGDRRAQRDPVRHYLETGAAAGLDPNPFFDTHFYLERHPDVVAAGKNALVHYIRYGAGQGRRTSPLFDTEYYLARNPQSATSGLLALAHYLEHGQAAGLVATRPTARRMVPDLLEWAAEHDRSAARRVLVVDHRMLTPDHDSGSVRMLAIVRLLRDLGHDVTFVSDSEDRHHGEGEAALTSLGVEVLYGYAELLGHLLAAGHRYGTALLSRPDVARRYLPLVRAHALWAKIVYDTVDLHWIRHQRSAELTGDPATLAAAARYRTLELLNATSSDLTLAITDEERDILARQVPDAPVDVLPNIHECAPSSVPWRERRGLIFIGGFEHLPNVDAVEWFVAQILPLVRERLPEAVFHVVGSKAPQRIHRLSSPAVQVHGYVADPSPLFHAARVFVSPLRYGAGMKGKIGQSMGLGLPVVTTSIGAEGMGLVDGTNALVVDDPAAFAEAVARLHEDELLWSRIGRAATAHLRERFSAEAVRSRVSRILGPGPAPGSAT